MSDTAHSTRPLTRLALVTSPRTIHIMTLGVGCMALAVIVSDQFAGLGFLVVGATLFALAGLIAWLVRHHRKSQVTIWHAAEIFCHNDTAPCFGTDEAGLILYQNPAANLRFSAHTMHLSGAIGDLFASPQSVLHRMRVKADDQGTVPRI